MPRSAAITNLDDLGVTSNDTAAASGEVSVSGETVFVMGASHGGLNSDSLASDDVADARDHVEIEVADEETIYNKKPKENFLS